MKLIREILLKSKKILVLISVLSLITAGISLVLPLLTKQVFNQGLLEKNLNMVLIAALLLLVLNLIYYLIEYGIQKSIVGLEQKATLYVRKKVIDDIIAKPLKFFEKYDTEFLVTRINESSSITSIISSDFCKFVISIITMIIALIYLFKINILWGILSIIISIIYIFVILLPMLKIFNIRNESLDETAEYNKKLFTAIQGISELKQYNQAEQFSDNITKSVEKIALLDAEQNNKINFNYNFLQASIAIINLVVSLIVAIYIMKGELTIGDYFLITQYVSLVSLPILQFQSFMVMCLFPFLSGIRLEKLDSEESDERVEGITISDIENIQLEHIGFSYNQKKVLNDVNLNINKSDIIQIVGENGSGKTTLLKIVMGLYQPEYGKIKVNGTDLNNYNLKQYRELIGVIPQKIFLFDASVEDNIRIGNTKLSEPMFQNKLRELESMGVLNNIDLDKVIIDNGKNLSGGQIKMIALARVLLRNPRLLILDEATTNMDTNLQKKFFDIIADLPNVCIIYISHIKEEFVRANREYYLN